MPPLPCHQDVSCCCWKIKECHHCIRWIVSSSRSPGFGYCDWLSPLSGPRKFDAVFKTVLRTVTASSGNQSFQGGVCMTACGWIFLTCLNLQVQFLSGAQKGMALVAVAVKFLSWCIDNSSPRSPCSKAFQQGLLVCSSSPPCSLHFRMISHFK